MAYKNAKENLTLGGLNKEPRTIVESELDCITGQTLRCMFAKIFGNSYLNTEKTTVFCN